MLNSMATRPEQLLVGGLKRIDSQGSPSVDGPLGVPQWAEVFDFR